MLAGEGSMQAFTALTLEMPEYVEKLLQGPSPSTWQAMVDT